MDRVTTIEHQDKTIVCVDISGFSIQDINEMSVCLKTAKDIIAKYPPKTALLVTNVANTNFNGDTVKVVKDYASHNTPYVKASAIIGLSGIQKIVLTSVSALTGRSYHLASSMEDAIAWLVKQ